jgi:hypothetical protein
MTTGAAITAILEAYGNRYGTWVPITEIAETVGLTRDELTDAITELMEGDDVQAEPQPFGHRITARDREIAPVIGGEARHLLCIG